ncbi:MAG: Rpn family recombination-promoting nuclease/putative transposase [Desulfovibrio sp.]|jgi:hypothetical protein|nr:Rpn family recombination-promoting nuclease/putative transposase [Desulfovibrio sp.]
MSKNTPDNAANAAPDTTLDAAPVAATNPSPSITTSTTDLNISRRNASDVFGRKWGAKFIKGLIKSVLTNKVYNQVDIDTIEQLDTNFFSSGLKNKICDILFRFQFTTDGGSGQWHYLLIEFNTSISKKNTWQFYNYHNLILQRFGEESLRKYGALPRVFTVFIYTGRRNSTLKPFASLVKGGKSLDEYAPLDLKFEFISIRNTSKELLRDHFSNDILLLLFKHDLDHDSVDEVVKTLDAFTKEEIEKDKKGVPNYSFYIADLIGDFIVFLDRPRANNDKSARALSKHYTNKENCVEGFMGKTTTRLTPFLKEMALNIKEENLIAEGEAKGLAKGLAEGEAKGEAKALQKCLLSIVEKRYPPISASLGAKIRSITEPETLYGLVDATQQYNDLAAFERTVENTLQQASAR